MPRVSATPKQKKKKGKAPRLVRAARPRPGPRTATRRQGERDLARFRIIMAATRLFAQHGRENVSILDVARRAGLSRPLVYFYFPDLNALFLEAAFVAGQRLHERLSAAVVGPGTGLDAVLAMARAYVRFQAEEPENFRLCVAASAGPRSNRTLSALEERQAVQQRANMNLLEEAVTRGKRDGSVRRDAGDSLPVSLTLWAFVHGLVQLSSNHRDTIERFYGVSLQQFFDTGFATLRGSLAPKR